MSQSFSQTLDHVRSSNETETGTHTLDNSILPKSYTLLLTDCTADEREPLILPSKRQDVGLGRVGNVSYSSTIGDDDMLNEYCGQVTLRPAEPPPAVDSDFEMGRRARSRYVSSSSSSSLGTALVLCSAVLFSASSFLVRVAEARYEAPALGVSAAVLGASAMISAMYIWSAVPVSSVCSVLRNAGTARLIVARGVLGATAAACAYRSFDLLPVGDAIAIYNVCPALTVVTAAVFLQEPAGWFEGISVVLGLLGAYMVASPSGSGMPFSTYSSPTSATSTAMAAAASDRLTGSLFALADAALSALAYTAVRFLGGKVHFSLSVGAVGLAGALLSAALGGISQLAQYVTTHPSTTTVIHALACSAGAALLMFAAQSLLDKGLQYCPAGRAMLLRTLEVPAAYALGMAFLGETPSATGAFGSALVVCAACIVAVAPKR